MVPCRRSVLVRGLEQCTCCPHRERRVCHCPCPGACRAAAPGWTGSGGPAGRGGPAASRRRQFHRRHHHNLHLLSLQRHPHLYRAVRDDRGWQRQYADSVCDLRACPDDHHVSWVCCHVRSLQRHGNRRERDVAGWDDRLCLRHVRDHHAHPNADSHADSHGDSHSHADQNSHGDRDTHKNCDALTNTD